MMFSSSGAVAAGAVAAGVVGYTIVSSNVSDEAVTPPVSSLVAPLNEETTTGDSKEITIAKVDPEISDKQPLVDEAVLPELVFSILRVEPDGSAVIAGSGPENSSVRLLDGGDIISTTQSGGGGDFAFVLDTPLEPGPHELSLEATLQTGQVIVSAESGFINVPEADKPKELAVLVSEPGEASRILVKPESDPVQEEVQEIATLEVQTDVEPIPEETAPATDEVVETPKPEIEETFAPVLLEAAEIEGNRFFLAGTGEPETTINVYLGDHFIGSEKVAENGAFLFEGVKEIAPGRYKVRADMLAKGSAKVLARAQVELIHQPVETQTVAEPEPVETEPEQQVAEAPSEETTEEKVIKTGSAVIIRRGDSLWRVAKRNYGAGIRYTTIFDANRDQVRNPDLIFPGQVLKVPDDQASGNASEDG